MVTNVSKRLVFATIPLGYRQEFVSDGKQAKRYFISGTVQGVGYRYFTQHAGAKLGIGGYVRNKADGRVEVFAIGTAQQLTELRTILERGPRLSSVSQVREETAAFDSQYENQFVITQDD